MITNKIEKDNTYKLLFWFLAIALMVIMPILSIHHGQSGDEWALIIYGNDIYDYFFKGSTKALNYDNISLQYAGMQYYGGLYDFTVTFIHKTFFPFIQELTFRHIYNSLIGALLFMYTGLIGKKFGGWRTAFFSLLFIALTPRLLGESMNNPKDIPFAFAAVFFIYYLICYITSFPEKKWKYAILMGVGIGLAIGFRIGGLLMVPYAFLFIGVYYLINQPFKKQINTDFKKNAQTIIKNLVVAIIIGYIIGIIFWPWALQAPLSNPLNALKEMTNRETYLRMLFEGNYIMNNEAPWYYVIKWIFISNPVLILLAFVLSIAIILPLGKRYGKAPLFILYFSFAFPILYTIYKHSTVYDTWRHFLFIYPNMVIIAALVFNYLLERAKTLNNKWLTYLVTLVIAVGLFLPLIWIIRTYPNEYVYFNEFEGGPQGAFGQYEFDYYQNSGKTAAEWLLKHAKHTPGKYTIVGSNMLGFDKYFAKDTNWIRWDYVRYPERGQKDWDYYVTYSRYISTGQFQNNTWPPANAVHVISVEGVPISAILERKSKDDMLAFGALQRQHYDSAIVLYQQYLKVDPYNESVYPDFAIALASAGHIDDALNVLKEGLKLDPANANIYQIEAQLYKAKGDMNNAQAAMNMAQQLSED